MCATAVSIFSADAQTDSTNKPTTTVSGYADAYYRYNFSNSSNKTNGFTSFTNSHNSFELGMASVKLDHSIGKIAATADLGFGKRAQDFSYNDAGSLAIVKQLYMTYAPSDKIKFTMGKWATHIGYELVDPTLNRNYSMSYGFSYGPFFHTGIKADISLGGKTALMIGIANPADYTTTSTSQKQLLVQLSTGTKNDQIKLWLNFLTGSDVTQYNLVATAVLASKWSMAYDGSIQRSNFSGTSSSWKSHAIYFNYDPSSRIGLTLRQDYFDDRKINPLNIGGKVYATTLSANIKIEKLTLIPELRTDISDQTVFSKTNGSLAKGTASFILAAVYQF